MALRGALIEAARKKFEEREREGYVAAISPTPDEVIEQVLNKLHLKLSKFDIVVDLG